MNIQWVMLVIICCLLAFVIVFHELVALVAMELNVPRMAELFGDAPFQSIQIPPPETPIVETPIVELLPPAKRKIELA